MPETEPDENGEEADETGRAAGFLHRIIVFVLLGCVAAALLVVLLSGFNPGMRTTVAFILAVALFLLFFSFALYVARGGVHFRKRNGTDDEAGDA